MDQVLPLPRRLPLNLRAPPPWVAAGVVVAFAVLGVMAAIAYRSLSAFEESARWVAHSYAVIAELGQLESGHARMRLAWRNYLATNAPDALDDYRASRQGLENTAAHLVLLTIDNPRQHARILALGDVLRQDMQSIDTSIAQKVAGSVDGSLAIAETIASLRGNGERIARLADTTESTERALLAEREQATAEQGVRAKAWIVAGSIASLAVLLAAFLALRQEMARRTRAQRRVERFAAEVEELYNDAPCGYHSMDRDGFVTRINDSELAMLGYARDEVVGRMRGADFMVRESALRFEQQFVALVHGDTLTAGEYTYRRKNGSEFVARIDAVRRRVEGGAEEVAAAMIDITRQKASENEVRNLNRQLAAYSDRLEASNRELESFSYSVSHDLRAPLRAINGFASMLEEDHADRLDDEGRRLLGVVRANAESMAHLIDDLLAFSRLGKVSYVKAPVDMAALVHEVLTERGTSRAAVKLGAMPTAFGDRALLKQVWANLIDNAMKYTSKVESPAIDISGDVDEGETRFCVADNGAGFDMRYYEKLFGVFQRLHSPSEFPGTGVGLAIVHRIVTRHGGRIWAEGRPDAGAIFHFALPQGAVNA